MTTTFKEKKYYEVSERVYLKELKKVGVIKELIIIPKTEENEGTYKASVTYFNDDKYVTKQFDLWNIDKIKQNKIFKQGKQFIIKVKYFDDALNKIEKIQIGNWIDLRSAVDVTLKQGEYRVIPLGVAMHLPYGFEAIVAPRSSTFKNFGVIQVNGLGVIDNSYQGNDDQWHMPVLAMRDTEIKKGDRIAQFRILRSMSDVEIVEVEELTSPNRSGFGSTGIN